ncbi:STE24 endopeptidase protein [Rutstroemia sp. NJR-2017a WRK4]|nr:STE24 endopeptidase protein [Rutstroemia sp. NJR-2017a WRK4]
MPTPIDRALSSKVLCSTYSVKFLIANCSFTGIVTAAAAWSIWGGDMFPKEADPTGDPETWSREELRRWLAAVRMIQSSVA